MITTKKIFIMTIGIMTIIMTIIMTTTIIIMNDDNNDFTNRHDRCR